MTEPTAFSGDEWLRYTRHVQLPQVGSEGQLRLKNSAVLIVGAGGLGSPVALYLAAAGVGTLILADHDTVDLTNLQRQILFTSKDVGQNKAQAGKAHLEALNSAITVEAICEGFHIRNAAQLIARADIVLDCTDNFSTRYLINDTCKSEGKSWVFSSIHQFRGQCSLFTPEGSCFRCLFPDFPRDLDDCNSAGVLGVLPGLLGTLQANEALKYLLGLPTPLRNHLMVVDALQLQFQKIRLGDNPECSSCHPAFNSEHENFYQEPACRTDSPAWQVSVGTFKTQANEAVIIDVRSGSERNAFHIGGQHYPIDKIENWSEDLDASRAYYLYCQSGVRSATATAFLRERGIQAFSLEGGLVKWLKAQPSC